MNKFLLMMVCAALINASAFAKNIRSTISVAADSVTIEEAKGLSTYQGNVVIQQDSLILKADTVKLFRGTDGVSKIVALGVAKKRARYEQSGEYDARNIQAMALSITLLPKKQLVRFEGNVRLTQGEDSFSGGALDYDIKNNKVIMRQSKDKNQRVQFKIKL